MDVGIGIGEEELPVGVGEIVGLADKKVEAWMLGFWVWLCQDRYYYSRVQNTVVGYAVMLLILRYPLSTHY